MTALQIRAAADVGTVELTEVDRYVLAVRLKGYLGTRREALALADEAVTRHPGSVRLLRLRGEKRLILRDLAGARDDFEAAVALLGSQGDELEFYRPAVETDIVDLVLGRPGRGGGQQRAKGTVHSAAWYYAGLARFLDGDHTDAVAAFTSSLEVAVDGYIGVAAYDWRYLALRRLGRDDEAGRSLDDVDTVGPTSARTADAGDVSRSLNESFDMRVGLYRGELRPEDLLRHDTTSPLALATLGYGVGAWYVCEGFTGAAARTWQRVVDHGDWASSGVVAAEIGLQQL